MDHPVPPRGQQETDAQRINLIDGGSSIEVVDRSCQYSRETEPKVEDDFQRGNEDDGKEEDHEQNLSEKIAVVAQS